MFYVCLCLFNLGVESLLLFCTTLEQALCEIILKIRHASIIFFSQKLGEYLTEKTIKGRHFYQILGKGLTGACGYKCVCIICVCVHIDEGRRPYRVPYMCAYMHTPRSV